MKAPYMPKISRRTTLKWLAAVTAVSSISQYVLVGTQKAAAQPISKGYGTDPNLNNPTVPWARTMTPHQLQLTAALADLILPGTESAPAPSALGIPDFVDEWVSAPYPEQQADRTIIFDGLKWIDAEANRRRRRDFLQIDDQHRQQIIAAMARKNNGTVATAQGTFFGRFRYVVVGAYYTTPAGFKDIGYIGNVALTSYPPVTERERAILDAELRKLGI